jgi:Flp pilus assembly pilin Flp
MFPVSALLVVAGALAVVTLIATIGAWASRQFRFNYGYLSIISFILYLLLGYTVSSVAGLIMALLASLVVSFYDATVGWKLALWMKANTEMAEEELAKITPDRNLMVMLFIGPLFAIMGHALV